MMWRTFVLAISGLAAVCLAPVAGQDPKPSGTGGHEPLNKRFEDPKLDVDAYVKRFGAETREVAAKQDEILAVCDLKPGMSVADIGAGTGLYTFPIARKVGAEGTVYAVDISPAFLKYLGEEAEVQGLAKVVKTVKGGHQTTNLQADSVDLVFLCDTYHHFEAPKPMLASIHEALRTGGRVVVIDFDKTPKSSAFIKEHARAEKEVYFQEFEDAGFTREEVPNPPSLGENFLAVFRKAKRSPAP